jgi:hypothetical protein
VKLASAVLLAALTLGQHDSVMADEIHRQHRHQPSHFAFADPDFRYWSSCGVGWWQTLRYGHVQPYWGVRCLKLGRSR